MATAAGSLLWYNSATIRGPVNAPDAVIVQVVGSNTNDLTFNGVGTIGTRTVYDHSQSMSNGWFKAPYTGVYKVSFGGNISALPAGQRNGYMQLCLNNNTNVIDSISADASITTNSVTSSMTCIAPLEADDMIYLAGSNSVVYRTPNAHMNVELLSILPASLVD